MCVSTRLINFEKPDFMFLFMYEQKKKKKQKKKQQKTKNKKTKQNKTKTTTTKKKTKTKKKQQQPPPPPPKNINRFIDCRQCVRVIRIQEQALAGWYLCHANVMMIVFA